MTTSKIWGQCEVTVFGAGFTDTPGDPATGKPYIELRFSDDVVVCVTANLAEMIGGVGRGATARYTDLQQEGRRP